MRIAIASGKGGAGKTTVTASLASVWEGPFIAVDADVEAPNLHLFLPPRLEGTETVGLEVPILDPERCTRCGACRDICRYKAIAQFASRLTIFPDMCHGCGGCFAVCPSGALTPGSRELGVLEHGTVLEGRGRFLMGRSRIGEAMTPPLLRVLRGRLDGMLEEAPGDALIDS
ncbi:4Fe-4S binding protein, partial [uncultured Bilophila sp.]